MDSKLPVILFIFFATVFNVSMVNTIQEECPNVKTPLNFVRKRRHLAFPDGSTASVATSAVKTFMTHIPSGWYLVIEAELVYHLPDGKFISATKRRKLHHRQKREFWEVLQNAFDQRNLNGRACVIRTVCEAKQNLAPPGKSLVHDILRAMFTAPLHEEDFTEEISPTYGELLGSDYCKIGDDCPFSCLNFVLDFNKQH